MPGRRLDLPSIDLDPAAPFASALAVLEALLGAILKVSPPATSPDGAQLGWLASVLTGLLSGLVRGDLDGVPSSHAPQTFDLSLATLPSMPTADPVPSVEPSTNALARASTYALRAELARVCFVLSEGAGDLDMLATLSSLVGALLMRPDEGGSHLAALDALRWGVRYLQGKVDGMAPPDGGGQPPPV